MKRLATAILCAFLATLSVASAQTLVEAKTTKDAVAAIRIAGLDRFDLIRDAIGLGAAEPAELVFALISPVTPAAEGEEIAHAMALAAPRRADEVAAATAIAAAIVGDEARLIGLIESLLRALAASSLDDASRDAEALEVLAALMAVTDPTIKHALADAVAGGDGAALLAALGEGPTTAAIDGPRPPFGEGPVDLTLTPGSAAQDAPSAN